MRRKLIAANWKMNKTIAEALDFAAQLKQGLATVPAACDLLLIPPFLCVPDVVRALAGTAVEVGVQDLYWEKAGAYTGEISTAMAADAGAEWALVGHSERRHVIGESNEIVGRKLSAAVRGGLKPILCVGEKIEEREAGLAGKIVNDQLSAAYDGLSDGDAARVVIAYEPVWAIGTGKTATPGDAREMHSHIRRWLADAYGEGLAQATRIQYGGSVKADNAASLLGQEEIDGALIGGAALEAESFLAIAGAGG